MDAIIQAFIKVKTSMVRFLEIVLMVALILLVLDVLWGVASRYLLGEQSSWTEELARVLLIWVVLLGAAVAFGTREHLGVDYFVARMDDATRKRMTLTADLVVLAFTVSVLLFGGFTLVSRTFSLNQMMMALGIPKAYVYLAVPVSGVFFLLFSLESITRARFTNQEGAGKEDAG
ncbi:MAG TPA: TRAP transporter small permease [bacterium]|nr:TRAP transporter small permease [bacterium]